MALVCSMLYCVMHVYTYWPKFAINNNCWFFATDINLQNLCLEKLSNWLKSTSDIDTLPLPGKLKVKLKSFIW